MTLKAGTSVEAVAFDSVGKRWSADQRTAESDLSYHESLSNLKL